MVYPLNYRRPEIPSSRNSYTSEEEKNSSEGSLKSGEAGIINGIPAALSFDKIVNDGACPPCTVRDFMNYLIYIDHSAENLQFYLWYRDYSQRFSKATTADIALAPEWTTALHDTAVQAAQAQAFAQKKAQVPIDPIFKGTDFDGATPPARNNPADPFQTPPRTPADTMAVNGKTSVQPWESSEHASEQGSVYTETNNPSFRQAAGEAFTEAGLKRPFTIQPFREEIDRVITTYFIKGSSPRELNISDRERTVLMKALEYTTHPSAFRAINDAIESTLRRQCHPRFIRWTICNGNPPRVMFARGLGIFLILFAFAAAIVLTLSNASRGYRAIAAFGWLIGIATLIAGWKGMCVVLHGMHHRHLRPWELFEDPESEVELKKKSFDSFDSSNSYEDSPWIVKYEKRNIIRKIFDREVWIKEPALRQIQDTIFIQSMLCSLVLTCIFTGIFVGVPSGHLF